MIVLVHIIKKQALSLPNLNCISEWMISSKMLSKVIRIPAFMGPIAMANYYPISIMRNLKKKLQKIIKTKYFK